MMTMTRKQQIQSIKTCIKALNPSISRVKLLDMVEVSKNTSINPIYENVFLWTAYNTYAYASKDMNELKQVMGDIGKQYYIITLSNDVYVAMQNSILTRSELIHSFIKCSYNPLIKNIILM